MFAPVVAFTTRLLLVLLFFPFSALDKVINFPLAVQQAKQKTGAETLAKLLIVAGFCVEAFMSLGVLTGVSDRLCALVLGLYCVVTAVLWKQFWRRPDFRWVGASQGRDEFWDFLKNLAVAGGFFLLAFGPTASSVTQFLNAPLAWHDPYRLDSGSAL